MMALSRPAPAQPAGGLLAWWLGELRELLPPRWRETGTKRPSLLLQLERPFIRVHERRGRRLESIGSLTLPDLETGNAPGGAGPVVEPRLRQALDRHRSATALVLGESDALTYVDTLPGSAENDLGKIMAHKLDLLTPWSGEQGYAAQKIMARRRDGTLEVLLAAAARPSLDRTLRQLAALGVTPTGVDVAVGPEPGRTAGIDLLRSSTSERPRRGRLLLLFVLLAALLAGGALWVGWQIYQRQLQLAEQTRLVGELDRRLADLPELRTRIDAMRVEANFLANDRRSRPSPLLVLEALSRLLPDSVWLSEITLDGRELAISGMADDAAALIPLVEAAPEFAQVRFQAPSTRMTVRGADGGDREVERFALRAVVETVTEPPP
jgi:general secretion pathway protein L